MIVAPGHRIGLKALKLMLMHTSCFGAINYPWEPCFSTAQILPDE